MGNIQLSSKAIKILSAIAVIFLVLNAVIFAVFGFADHTSAFWISYIFLWVSFVTAVVSFMLLRTRSVQPRDWLLGYPIMKHCVIYLVLETLACLLFMALDVFTDLPWAVSFVVQIIIFAVHIVLNISCFLAKEMVEEVEVKVATNSKHLKILQVDVEMIADKSVNAEVKQAYTKLAERIRYSDPMSNELLKGLEAQLDEVVEQAKQAVAVSDDQNALILCQKADSLLTERNKKCMACK